MILDKLPFPQTFQESPLFKKPFLCSCYPPLPLNCCHFFSPLSFPIFHLTSVAQSTYHHLNKKQAYALTDVVQWPMKSADNYEVSGSNCSSNKKNQVISYNQSKSSWTVELSGTYVGGKQHIHHGIQLRELEIHFSIRKHKDTVDWSHERYHRAAVFFQGNWDLGIDQVVSVKLEEQMLKQVSRDEVGIWMASGQSLKVSQFAKPIYNVRE